MWSTLVTCYIYRTFKLSLLDSPPTYNSAIIRKMFQTLLSITKSFFVDQLWFFLMLHKMVLRIMYIFLGPSTSFLKTIGKEFWMLLKNISNSLFLFNHMCKFPSITSCDEVEWKLMKEAGSVLMMIKKYNRIWHLFQISVIDTSFMYICYHFVHLWPVYFIRHRSVALM